MHSITGVLRRIRLAKKRGKKIVFTNGCFDLIHAGHVRLLKQAKSLGDVLVVGINTDRSVRWLKGPSRPILSLKDRIEVLSGLESVDFVVPFAEKTPHKLIEAIRPNVLIKGGDWPVDRMAGGREVVAGGGKVVSGLYVKGKSTSQIIDKIRKG